jgi:hypothetical protein
MMLPMLRLTCLVALASCAHPRPPAPAPAQPAVAPRTSVQAQAAQPPRCYDDLQGSGSLEVSIPEEWGANHAICIGARFQPDLTATLHYRVGGQAIYTALAMQRDEIGDDFFSAMIPREATLGTSVQLYIELTDPQGKLVARFGAETSPWIIYLDSGERPCIWGEMSDG